MVLREISVIGMCEAECIRSETIRLAIGEELRVNQCPSGNACIQLGALAARYSAAELETLGNGNGQIGIMHVAAAMRENPAAIVDGSLRPFDDMLATND